jgi:pyruvate dehydrogenase E1 component beta subunit
MFVEAINEALREELRRDPNVFMMGENLELGMFGAEKGLYQEFGPERIRYTPISEAGFTGAATGASLLGMRPIVEYGAASFMYVATDQLIAVAGRLRYATGGDVCVPVTYLAMSMGGGGAGPQHSDNICSLFVHYPGFKVVYPSTPYDAKGLLKSAIRDDNPVLFAYDIRSSMERGEVPDEEYLVPIGKGDIKREGKDVTVVAVGSTVQMALEAAQKVAEEGVSVEIVDPRTLKPLDTELILNSVAKTGRLVVCLDDYRDSSFASDVAAIVADQGFKFLKAPIKRVARAQVPAPYTTVLEKMILPNTDKIVEAIKEVTA